MWFSWRSLDAHILMAEDRKGGMNDRLSSGESPQEGRGSAGHLQVPVVAAQSDWIAQVLWMIDTSADTSAEAGSRTLCSV